LDASSGRCFQVTFTLARVSSPLDAVFNFPNVAVGAGSVESFGKKAKKTASSATTKMPQRVGRYALLVRCAPRDGTAAGEVADAEVLSDADARRLERAPSSLA
jgi:hypothetical protein